LFASPKKSKLLVFDEVSASQLNPIILDGMEFVVLSKRGERYYLGANILLKFISNLGQIKRNYILRWSFDFRQFKGLLYVAYLLAWIQCVRPRVVITFIDNDWQFQMLSRLYCDALFIAIQNGVRSEFNLRFDLPIHTHPGARISMPLLYCFGQCETEIYPEYGHLVDKLIPVGSIRASWYREEIAPKINIQIVYDILLISQWERTIMIDGCYPEILHSLDKMNDYIKTYLSRGYFRFGVALRSNESEEKEFFRKSYGENVKLIERNVERMSSYFAIDQSDTVIVFDSTIGREAYGWGKKVLFVNYTAHEMYYTPVDPSCYIDEEDFHKFELKLTSLINESNYAFRIRTECSREWIMNNAKNSYDCAHNKIRNDLKTMLSQG
jgi:surface carbohydrate biosynthesis protein